MMKRKMTSAFAVAAVMGVATAFAVNPFSDVPSDSWGLPSCRYNWLQLVLSRLSRMVTFKGQK